MLRYKFIFTFCNIETSWYFFQISWYEFVFWYASGRSCRIRSDFRWKFQSDFRWQDVLEMFRYFQRTKFLIMFMFHFENVGFEKTQKYCENNALGLFSYLVSFSGGKRGVKTKNVPHWTRKSLFTSSLIAPESIASLFWVNPSFNPSEPF